MTALLLMVGIAAVMLLSARKDTLQLKAKVLKKVPPAQYLPKAISLALIAAQVSELLKMIEQVSIVHLAAALLLCAMVLAARSGVEAGLHDM